MKTTSSSKIVQAALFAALIFIGTQFIKVPLVLGYFHVGDALVLFGAYYIGGIYAISASVIGSVLADIMSGFAVYVPATIIIKALMAVIMILLCRKKDKNKRKLYERYVIGAVLAEAVMVCTYYLFEHILYGHAGAVVALMGNVLQGSVGIAVSIVLLLIFIRK